MTNQFNVLDVPGITLMGNSSAEVGINGLTSTAMTELAALTLPVSSLTSNTLIRIAALWENSVVSATIKNIAIYAETFGSASHEIMYVTTTSLRSFQFSRLITLSPDLDTLIFYNTISAPLSTISITPNQDLTIYFAAQVASAVNEDMSILGYTIENLSGRS